MTFLRKIMSRLTDNEHKLVALLLCIIKFLLTMIIVMYQNTKANSWILHRDDKSVLCCNLFKDQPCQKCEGGWEQDGGQCYFFSISRSSWEDSRNECKRRGGDLVKIDSREEQSFLKNRLQKMDNRDKFWIGLTDSAVEGEWLWVDGSQLSKSFWFWQEPDNWRLENPDGEDCARMGEGWWWDKSCKAPQKSICEKQEEMGRTAVTCV
uniref:C-type lectin domain-containing protein n=1 Tax=Seriola lalandi dorsalis TaxID=1841481 RepID=A0A3B4Y7V5_SERLL